MSSSPHIHECRSILALTPSAETFAAVCDALGTPPFDEPTLTYVRDHVSRWPQEIERAMPSPWLRALAEGTLHPGALLCNRVAITLQHGKAALHALCEAPLPKAPLALALHGLQIGDEGARKLAQSPLARRLIALDIRQNAIGARALGDLIRAIASRMGKN